MSDCGFWVSFGWYIAGLATPFAVIVLVGIFAPDKWMMH